VVVLGGCKSGTWVDNFIGWRWGLFGKGTGICIYASLFVVPEAKREVQEVKAFLSSKVKSIFYFNNCVKIC